MARRPIYESESGNITLALGGDIMLSRPLKPYAEPDFLGLVEILRGADATFGNFEGTARLPDEGTPSISQGTYMTTAPALLDDLKWFGVNMVSTANNHAFDFGEGGVLSTMRHLDAAGIARAGSGRNLTEARAPGYHDTRGGRVAVLASTATFFPWSRAGEARPDAAGRPGINPLRFTTTYQTDAETVAKLRALSERLGLARELERNKQHFFSERDLGGAAAPDDAFLLGSRFVAGKETSFSTKADEGDVLGSLKWISEAKRAADWVIASVHSHEFAHESVVSAEKRSDLAQPADAVIDYSHRAIDAGADMVVGHGSHTALGIEIYKGKPIFHSLGNLIFQNDTVKAFPSEAYERFDLTPDSTPADFLDVRTNKDRKGHPGDPAFWESIVPVCRYAGGALVEIALHPIDLGHGRPRGQRGRPVLARGEVAAGVLDRVARLSQRYGTSIRRDGEVAYVELPGSNGR